MMKKKLFLATAIMLFTAMTVQAVPAKPGAKQKVQLADGTTVELTLCGDEHFSFYRNDNDQLFQLIDNKLVSLSKEEVQKKWTAMRELRLSPSTNASRSNAHRRIGTPSITTTGKQRGLVILMEFPDVKFITQNPKEFFNRFFNEPGFNEDGMIGSVRDYFLAQSYNQLEIDFDVVGPFCTKYDLEFYGHEYTDKYGNLQHDANPGQMIAEGVDAASKEVDFTKYDWNKDGEVDQVFVIYAGYNEAQGADKNTIWPHEYKLSYEGFTRKYNNEIIDTYGCSSELQGNGRTETGTIDGIGTACHEFSHCLGLPDMYDTNYKNYGMGRWDLMDSGSYNNNSRTPAGYTAYERWFSRWMEPVELTTETQITDMKPLVEAPEAYVLYNENNRNEYYLLENRQPVSYDKGIGGHGLLVVHVDYNKAAWENNAVNSTEGHERMSFIAADNKYTYATIAGDAFPGTQKKTSLTNITTPAATLFNTNKDGRKLMSKAIENITENNTTHTVSFMACRPELQAPAIDPKAGEYGENSYTISWTPVEEATSYEVELSTIKKASSDPKEALQGEFSFDKFYSKSNGYSDIGGKLYDYGLTGWSGTKIFTSPNLMLIGTSSVNGTLRTATWYTPQSTNMTIAVKAGAVSTPVKLTVQVGHGENGGSATFVDATQDVTDSTLYVFNFTDIRSSLFYININPTGRMYLKYLAIYDGIWSKEDLLDESASRPMYAANVTTKVYKTTESTFTFTNLSEKNSYAYRIRSIGENDRYSDWTEEQAFDLELAGINEVRIQTGTKNQRCYDLQGREVTVPQKKGIYIINGKKIIF